MHFGADVSTSVGAEHLQLAEQKVLWNNFHRRLVGKVESGIDLRQEILELLNDRVEVDESIRINDLLMAVGEVFLHGTIASRHVQRDNRVRVGRIADGTVATLIADNAEGDQLLQNGVIQIIADIPLCQDRHQPLTMFRRLNSLANGIQIGVAAHVEYLHVSCFGVGKDDGSGVGVGFNLRDQNFDGQIRYGCPPVLSAMKSITSSGICCSGKFINLATIPSCHFESLFQHLSKFFVRV